MSGYKLQSLEVSARIWKFMELIKQITNLKMGNINYNLPPHLSKT